MEMGEIHPQAFENNDKAHDTNQYPQSPPSKAKAVLHRLKAGMQWRKRGTAGQ